MTLWLVMSVLMAVTVVGVCWPLLRQRAAGGGESATVYKAQLSEIEREESAGLMSNEDARLARTEVERRLIGAARIETSTVEPPMNLTDRTTFIAIAAAIAVGSGVLYAVVGSPDAPPGRAIAMTPTGPADSTTVEKNIASVDEMMVKLESRLEEKPDDAEGWRMLGWSKFRTNDFAGAAVAYSQAVKLAPDDAETQSAFGEALTRAAGGQVTEDATKALQAALKLDAADARARFLLGLRKDQRGDPRAALDDWLTMLSSAPADAPWFDEVRSRAVELSQSSGLDISKRLPEPRTPLDSSSLIANGPTQQDVSEAAAMPAEDRQAMIDGMVSRLDARLKQNPQDLDGWLKLIRARRVLGQEDLASRALAGGQAVFVKDKNALAKLKAAFTESLALPPT